MKDGIAEQRRSLIFLDLAEVIQNIEHSKGEYINEVCNLISILLLVTTANNTIEGMFSALIPVFK